MQELTDMHAQDISKSITKLINKGLLTQQGYGRGTTYTLSDLFNVEEKHVNHEEEYANHEDKPNNHEEECVNHEDKSNNHEEEYANHEDKSNNHEEEYANHEDKSNNHEEEYANHEDKPNNHEEEKFKLYNIAKKARNRKRLSSIEMKEIIIELCTEQYLTSREIADLTNRNAGSLARYLRNLVKEEKLKLKYPDSLNHKFQAYKTK